MLNLGVAREIITPKVGCNLFGYRPDLFSESIADDLTATAFYFEQDDKKALMVSLTICILNVEFADEILNMIEEKFNIPKSCCMLCATHTHSGPSTGGLTGWGDIDHDYCYNILVPKIMTIVQNAISNIEPVKMGFARGISHIGINRRQLTPDNTIVFGQNPYGCYNPLMSVLSFKNKEGKIIANMIHYGIHSTCAGANTEITRDFSGVMTDTLEEYTGAITAFFNGPEGDVGPRLTNGRTVGNLKFVHELGHAAAQDAVRIFKTINSFHDVDLKVASEDVVIPLKKRMSVNEAKVLIKEYENDMVNSRGLIRQHLEDIIASHEVGVPDEESKSIRQTVIALGNTVFAGTAYEMFSEIAIRMDNYFEEASILALSNVNGSEGYFVTEDAICRGGYEVDMFLYHHLQGFVNNADWHFYKNSVENIKKVIN